MKRRWLGWALLLMTGCGFTPEPTKGNVDAGSESDASAGISDGGVRADAGQVQQDAAVDASVADASVADAAVSDGALEDAQVDGALEDAQVDGALEDAQVDGALEDAATDMGDAASDAANNAEADVQ